MVVVAITGNTLAVTAYQIDKSFQVGINWEDPAEILTNAWEAITDIITGDQKEILLTPLESKLYLLITAIVGDIRVIVSSGYTHT